MVMLPTVVVIPIRRHVHLSLKLLIVTLVQLSWRRSIRARSAMLLVTNPSYLLAFSL